MGASFPPSRKEAQLLHGAQPSAHAHDQHQCAFDQQGYRVSLLKAAIELT